MESQVHVRWGPGHVQMWLLLCGALVMFMQAGFKQHKWDLPNTNWGI